MKLIIIPMLTFFFKNSTTCIGEFTEIKIDNKPIEKKLKKG